MARKREPTAEGAEMLADLVGVLVSNLPDGITATVILCAGDRDHFEVAVAGSTHPDLLRLVLRRALERLEDRVAANDEDVFGSGE